MRAGDQNEEQHEHDARQLVPEAPPHQGHGVGVMLHVWMLEAHLADEPTGVDGDQAHADGDDDAGHHAQARKGARHAEGAQSDGFDDEAHGETFPAELVVFDLAFGDGGAAA